MLKYPLKHYFTYHAPKAGQQKKYDNINMAAYNLAEIIEANCPDSPERTIALRKVMEARMTANQSIAVNE